MLQKKIAGVLAFVSVFAVSVAETTLKVELDNTIRPASHCASGSLYGLTETLPGNVQNDLVPLRPYVFCQPPLAGSGHQQPFGSAIPCAERIASSSGQVMITLADFCPYWPYRWPGKETWLNWVRNFIQEKLKSKSNNYYGYLIWNERHGTWRPNQESDWSDALNASWLNDCWKPTYDLIRQLDPTAKIIGPGDSYYNESRIKDFLTFCKNNNCVPDNICWHELMGANRIASDIKAYRNLEKSLGLPQLDIDINEYSDNVHENEGCPGYSVPFIAKFERYKVASACISYWFTEYSGRLGSLLTPNNERGGGWYLYQWYGQMDGNMVNVVCPKDDSKGVDGFANLDAQKNFASVCLGGEDVGTVNVQISGIPESFGSSVKVKVERVTWVDKDTHVNGTDVVSEKEYNVVNGAISVSVNNENKFYAYRISLTPAVFELSVDLDFPQTVTAGDKVALAATANASNGVSHIDFSANDVVFRHKYIYPYIHDTIFSVPGIYKIKTVVFDNEGNSAKDSAWITVRNAKDFTNDDVRLVVANDSGIYKGKEASLQAIIPEDMTVDHIDFNVDGENLVHKYIKPYVWHFTPSQEKEYTFQIVVYLPGQEQLTVQKNITAAHNSSSIMVHRDVSADFSIVSQADFLTVIGADNVDSIQLFSLDGGLIRSSSSSSISVAGLHGCFILSFSDKGIPYYRTVIVR